MSAGKLIRFFSTFTKLPIRAEDVRAQIIEIGVQDEIYFVPMDVPEDSLLGMFVRCKKKSGVYTESVLQSIIFYNSNASPEHQNLICIKELMHVFDHPMSALARLDDFQPHIEYLFSNSSERENFSLSGFHDYVAFFKAVAVMFPHEIRDDFIAAKDEGRMTVPQIALELGLPPAVVSQVLLPRWEETRELLLKLSE